MSALKDLLPIKTVRLLLRVPEQDEAHLITAYVNENREYLRPWEPRRSEGFYTTEFWQTEIKKIHNEFFLGQSLRLCVFPGKSPEGPIIGVCNFTNILRGVFQACFLGYSVHHRYQGQGIMYEALDAAVDFVFKHLKLHRVMANYMPRNEKSGRLLRKLGFIVEGYARDYLKIAGKWEDHILTAKISPY
ncbi:MAG: ribosomal protein S5-alanine N-acetyltransferase [Candidatus Aminicenantes bacterium]|nr:MAG: ribosomal protein S5-alanine N-acetyltransferase [Candidatus Aminicenantes bacterium]